MIPYDYDAVVIGAGPAGIAAALRLRWLKGYHPIPASVCLVDPEPPGGLAAIGGCILTGPSWAMGAEGILGPLLADLSALAIPQRRARAVSLRRSEAGLVEISLSDGGMLRAHAAILATGFRGLHGEARYFGRGLHLTYKGYAFFPELLKVAARDAGGRGLAILGHGASAALLPLAAPHAAAAGGITFLLQPGSEIPGALPPGIAVKICTTRGYVGEARLEGVEIEEGGESPRISTLPCGAALVDYHAFERRPEAWGEGSPAVEPGALPLPRRGDGFIEVNAAMETPTQGVFAAGDVTGRFASTAMALGDGVCAGFSCYTYIYRRKFGLDPSLFAYAATGPSPEVYADAEVAARPFPLPGGGRIIPLGPRDGRPEDGAPPALREALVAPSPWTVADLRRLLGEAEADRALFKAMHGRRLTLHALHPSACG